MNADRLEILSGRTEAFPRLAVMASLGNPRRQFFEFDVELLNGFPQKPFFELKVEPLASTDVASLVMVSDIELGVTAPMSGGPLLEFVEMQWAKP